MHRVCYEPQTMLGSVERSDQTGLLRSVPNQQKEQKKRQLACWDGFQLEELSHTGCSRSAADAVKVQRARLISRQLGV